MLKALRIFSVLSLTLGCLAALWGFWIEPASLKQRSTNVALPNWPASCSGFTIAVLADLHVGSPYNGLDSLERVIDQTLAAKPDLVLLPGDFVIHGVVGGSFVPPEDAAASLGRLAENVQTFAVLGNHDWWLDGPRVISALESNRIPVLEDSAVEISNSKCSFWLAGVSDFWEAPHDVDGALENVPDLSPVIVFTHNPDVFPNIPDSVSLTIAGHTHGGQVYIPGVGRPKVPSEYGERYAIGHIIESGKNLFVSSGIGTSILPVRFLVPPEVSIVRIIPASD